MMILVAVIVASLASLTGILAIGSGQHWQFKTRDYFRGKRNAVLYFFVTMSTIVSITHAGFLVGEGVAADWVLASNKSVAWMILHSFMSLQFILTHLFVSVTLAKEVGPVDKYLWGTAK